MYAGRCYVKDRILIIPDFGCLWSCIVQQAVTRISSHILISFFQTFPLLRSYIKCLRVLSFLPSHDDKLARIICGG
jgi:hypothetical protein